jgi:hypothetical protein
MHPSSSPLHDLYPFLDLVDDDAMAMDHEFDPIWGRQPEEAPDYGEEQEQPLLIAWMIWTWKVRWIVEYNFLVSFINSFFWLNWLDHAFHRNIFLDKEKQEVVIIGN